MRAQEEAKNKRLDAEKSGGRRHAALLKRASAPVQRGEASSSSLSKEGFVILIVCREKTGRIKAVRAMIGTVVAVNAIFHPLHLFL